MLLALGLLAVVIVLVAANALFVGVEFGYLTVDRNEVRALKEDGDTRATALDSSLAATSTNLSGAQLGITLSSLLVGYLTGPSVGELLTGGLGLAGMGETAARGTAMTAAFVVVTFLQMVFGELVPKNWAIAAPMRVARLSAALPGISASRVPRRARRAAAPTRRVGLALRRLQPGRLGCRRGPGARPWPGEDHR